MPYTPPASAASGSALLNSVAYRAGSDSNYQTTSTAGLVVAVDDANLVLPFTVPASGRVLFRMSGFNLTSGINAVWALLDGGGSLVSSSEQMCWAVPTAGRTTYSNVFSGLTPGASLTWKWAWRCHTSGTIYLYTGPVFGAATMEVWSL